MLFAAFWKALPGGREYVPTLLDGLDAPAKKAVLNDFRGDDDFSALEKAPSNSSAAGGGRRRRPNKTPNKNRG